MFRSLGPKPSAIATDEGFAITYEDTKHVGRPNKVPERQQRVKAKSIKYVRPCSPERSSQVSGHNKHPLYSEDGSGGGGGQHPPPNKDFAQQINALLNDLNQGDEEDEARHDHSKVETIGAHIKALQKKKSIVIADNNTNADDSSNNKEKQKQPAAQAQAQTTTGFGWPSSPPPPDSNIYNNNDDDDEGDHWRSQVGSKRKMFATNNNNNNNTGLTPPPLATTTSTALPASFAGGGISVDVDLLQIHMHKQAHAGPTTASTKPSQRPHATTTNNNNNNKATMKRSTPKSLAAHSLLLASSKKKSPRTTVYTIRDETTTNSGGGGGRQAAKKMKMKKSNKMKKGMSSLPVGFSSEEDDDDEEEVIEDDSESEEEEEEEHLVVAVDQHEQRDGRQTGTSHSHQSVLHAPVTLPFTLEHQAAYKTPANGTPIFSNNNNGSNNGGGGGTTRLAALLGANKQTQQQQQQQGASPFPPPPNNTQYQQPSAAAVAVAGPSTYPGAQQQHPSLHTHRIRHLLATAPSQQQQPHSAPSSSSPPISLPLQQHHHHPIGNTTTRRRGAPAAGLYARAQALIRVEQQALNQSHRQGNGVHLVCQGLPQYEGDLTKVLCTPLDNNSSQEVVGTTVMVVMSGRVARSLECCLGPGVRVTVQRPFKVMQQVPGVQWPVIMATRVTGSL